MIRLKLWICGVPFLVNHISGYRMLICLVTRDDNLITWLRWCLTSLSYITLLFFPLKLMNIWKGRSLVGQKFHSGISISDHGLVAKSCPTLCNPMDCSLPGFLVHGIFQGIILEWIAISFCRGFSWSRDQTLVSFLAGSFFTTESPENWRKNQMKFWPTQYFVIYIY